MKAKVIIVDIDGTLANCEHRRHHVQNKPKDWPAFYAACVDDTPNNWCIELIRSFSEQRVGVILCSGRHEELRTKTQDWLTKYQVPYLSLLMRKNGDYRQDAIVKEEILKGDILPNYDVILSVDDRKQVVDMWRKNGIVCLQCDEGDF